MEVVSDEPRIYHIKQHSMIQRHHHTIRTTTLLTTVHRLINHYSYFKSYVRLLDISSSVDLIEWCCCGGGLHVVGPGTTTIGRNSKSSAPPWFFAVVLVQTMYGFSIQFQSILPLLAVVLFPSKNYTTPLREKTHRLLLHRRRPMPSIHSSDPKSSTVLILCQAYPFKRLSALHLLLFPYTLCKGGGWHCCRTWSMRIQDMLVCRDVFRCNLFLWKSC